jgi:hypothetical protein
MPNATTLWSSHEALITPSSAHKQPLAPNRLSVKHNLANSYNCPHTGSHVARMAGHQPARASPKPCLVLEPQSLDLQGPPCPHHSVLSIPGQAARSLGRGQGQVGQTDKETGRTHPPDTEDAVCWRASAQRKRRRRKSKQPDVECVSECGDCRRCTWSALGSPASRSSSPAHGAPAPGQEDPHLRHGGVQRLPSAHPPKQKQPARAGSSQLHSRSPEASPEAIASVLRV